jgi:hypothetical protein
LTKTGVEGLAVVVAVVRIYQELVGDARKEEA